MTDLPGWSEIDHNGVCRFLFSDSLLVRTCPVFIEAADIRVLCPILCIISGVGGGDEIVDTVAQSGKIIWGCRLALDVTFNYLKNI